MTLGYNELVPACPTNITYWSQNLIPNMTEVRALHVNELRDAINRENIRRRLSPYTYIDDPYVVADVHEVRKAHADDLRAAIERAINAPDCVTDTTVAFPPAVWTDPTITAGVTEIRNLHHLQERSKVNEMELPCICDCNYCACNCNCTCCDHSNCKSCTHGW
jgi:hypothetical protein